MKKKIALITGINGQDGSYLAKYLLKKIIMFLAYQEGLLIISFKD